MNRILISGLLVAMSAAGGFWGGTLYQKGKMPTRPDFASLGANAGQGTNGASANRRSAGPGGLTGEITSKDETSLTIKTSTGSTQTAYYSNLTKVVTDQTANLSDIKTGSNVTIVGTPNSDGSVTADTVRLTD